MAYNPVRTFDQPSGGLWEWLSGSPERIQQVQNFTPEQQSAFMNMLQQGQQGLGGLSQQYGGINQQLQQLRGNQPQFDFGPIEQQETNRFYSQTAPGIAEMFTSMGPGKRSGAFQGAIGAAGAGLSDSLAALKAQYGLRQQEMGQQYGLENARLGLAGLGQQQGLYQSQVGAGLTPQFDTYHRQPEEGYLSRQWNNMQRVAPAIAGAFLGGPAGAAAGAQFGNMMGGQQQGQNQYYRPFGR